MDYEKAYNEALERAREIKSKILSSHLSTESCKAVSEYIDTIIPELVESEDEKTAKEIKEFILYKAGHLLDEDTEHRFVKYLERQKECLADNSKTSESEDDEEMLDRIICQYEEANNEALKQKCSFSYNTEIKFLKSLRPKPHWKPNEEQMMFLQEYIKELENRDANCGLDPMSKEFRVFNSLYNDLKKL